MGKEKTSRTEKDSFIEERIFGDHHYKTTISDGEHFGAWLAATE